MKRPIAVAYDGSEGSTRALDRAISDAAFTETALLVIAVEAAALDPLGPPSTPMFTDITDASTRRLRRGILPPALEPIIAEAKARARAAGVSAQVVWAIGDPAREIVDLARLHHASTVVIGAHHHHFLESVFGGDVTGEVRRGASCAVIVVD